jgi:hypothetical protein
MSICCFLIKTIADTFTATSASKSPVEVVVYSHQHLGKSGVVRVVLSVL